MKRRGYLLILGAIILFSTIEVTSKYLQSGEGAAGEVGAMQVAALRFLFGTAFLLPLLAGRRQRRSFGEALRRDGLPIAILGAVGIFLTFILFHLSVERTNASTAAVLISLTPVFTALIALAVLGERLGPLGWTGVAIGLLGAFMAITGFQFSGLFGREEVLGGFLMLLSAVSWSIYTVYGKRYAERYGGLVFSLLSMAVGSILYALLLTFQGGWGEMAGYTLRAWGWLLYLGAITVSLGYILYFEGLRRVPASRGASLFYLKPVLAILLAHWLLGESISCILLLASLLVAAGILLITLPGDAGSNGACGEGG